MNYGAISIAGRWPGNSIAIAYIWAVSHHKTAKPMAGRIIGDYGFYGMYTCHSVERWKFKRVNFRQSFKKKSSKTQYRTYTLTNVKNFLFFFIWFIYYF